LAFLDDKMLGPNAPILGVMVFMAILFMASAFSTVSMTVSSPKNHNSVSGSIGISRRVAVAGMFGLAAGTILGPKAAFSAENEVDVYFGCGCFWHVQHEFIEAERSLLGRADLDLTARAGYAGGTQVGKDTNRPGGPPLVCYHNLQRVGDYGRMGHGEVVGMTIPESAYADFAEEYMKLFGKKNERADPQDKGGEYRSLCGLPGGSRGPLYPALAAAAERKGLKLVDGKGNEPDTLGKKIIYVMDSDKFPFYTGEVYHQFHNDMIEKYPKEYNNLMPKLYQAGKLEPTGCPDIV